MVRFEPDWLAARRPFDDAALDPGAVEAIRSWSSALARDMPVTVVDLGSGTGAALHRALDWLVGRPVRAFAVDTDAGLLAAARSAWLRWGYASVTPVLGDLLGALDEPGGPADGEADLVLGHALADLLALDRLAGRLAALPRPGGLVHLALTYDGEMTFVSADDSGLEAGVLRAYQRHMYRPRAAESAFVGCRGWRWLSG